MYRTVFNFNRWESVKSFINGLRKLSLRYILELCKVKFYFHLLYSIGCSWICSGYITVIVILQMIACTTCSVHDMRLSVLCMSSLVLIV